MGPPVSSISQLSRFPSPETVPFCVRGSAVEKFDTWSTKPLWRIEKVTGARVLATRICNLGLCRSDDLMRADVVEQGHSERGLCRYGGSCGSFRQALSGVISMAENWNSREGL